MRPRWKAIAIPAIAFFAGCSNVDTIAQLPDDDTADSTESSSSNAQAVDKSSDSKESSSALTSSSSQLESSSSVPASSSSTPASSSSMPASSSFEEKPASSSSAVLDCSDTSWRWCVPKERYFNQNLEYGTLTDNRDGRTYKTILINGLTWMAENLNYGDSVATSSLKGNSWCYNDNPAHCEVTGRLYTWAAALAACPSGWHLPTISELGYLNPAITGEEDLIKSAIGWYKDDYVNRNGNNALGFSALPAGIRTQSGEFAHVGDHTAYWSSTISEDGKSYSTMFMNGNPYQNVYPKEDRNTGISVRCVMDIDKTLPGWRWDVPKEARFNPNVAYGSMTDERDNKVYRTVKIGNRTWMAENLNYADSVKTPSLKGRSWCHDNIPARCDIAGRLYSWTAAVDSVALPTNHQECEENTDCYLPEKWQGICPNGWHLPDSTEMLELIAEAGGPLLAGRKLKATNGWNGHTLRSQIWDVKDSFYVYGNGTDDFGFSILPIEEANNQQHADGSINTSFYDYGSSASFWFNGTCYNEWCNIMGLYSTDDISNPTKTSSRKIIGRSVRCVKD